ncbi:MAG TPA: HAMP domain-containing sensor histidine kinase [Vicinamibacterales bacterium]|nr:HAMP domain-containing sensor histidine kinase [Vicinamibacterales bacterium]
MDPQQSRSQSAGVSRSTRPSAFSHLLSDRAIRLGVGLAIVVAIPVAVLFYFQFRSLDDLEEASAVVLRQLSQNTADSAAQDIQEALKRPHIDILLRPTQQGRLTPPDFAWLDTVFSEGLTANPFIQELWLWSENADQHSNKFYVYDRGVSLKAPAGALDQRFREMPARATQMLPLVRTIAGEARSIVAFPAVIDGRNKYVQLQLGWDGPERQRVVRLLGFMIDVDYLRTVYFPSLLQRRLSTVQQLKAFPPLELYLVDGDGKPVAAPETPAVSGGFVDERSFPLVFFDRELLEYAAPYEQRRETWRLRTGYGAATIPEIVSASTRPQVALTIVLALVMAGGIFFVAGAAAREVRVAELKSNFVASVSHDLKTPLALIQLFAETLELGRVRSADRAQEYYRIINTEARKLTRLIENILDFSKMEAGLRPYRKAPADIGEVTTKVLARMESQFAQTHFNVTTRVEPGLPRVLIDDDAAEQAIENLLANAMKYSGESREIQVSVGRANSHVCVSVIDRGIGISRREQKRIFRKFYRVDSGLGGGPQGCGLGLAIVDHTMRGHGGFVRVDSEPDRGSTFTLHFPIPAGGHVQAPTPGPSTNAVEGDRHETHTGDRGRAADVARSA